MIKVSSLFVLFLFAAKCFALSKSSCKDDPKHLVAKYEISKTYSAKKEQKVNTHINLWRRNQEVAHEFPEREITEIWNLVSNGQVRPIRYFEKEQRAIEYQPGEVNNGKGEKNWAIKFQLVSNEFKDAMKLQSTTGEGCDVIEQYTLRTQNSDYQLSWSPSKQLVVSYVEKTPVMTTKVTLTDTNTDIEKINAFYAKRETYLSTDFADIGDNESDPFLLNMINLGFIEHGASGFYAADGTPMEAENSHHKHGHHSHHH